MQPLHVTGANATRFDIAPQHGPRPLPLFLAMLRNETAASPDRRARALAGLDRYQAAPRDLPLPPRPIRASAGRAVLRDYGGGTTGKPAVIVIPSLINPAAILDLSADTSLMQWLATRGYHAHLLDWGTPGPEDRDLDLDAHVARILLPLLHGFAEPPILVGYCLGGTLAVAAAALTRAAGLATIAAPWHFAGYGKTARGEMARLWRAAAPFARQTGLLPMEVLQSGFWQLAPAQTIAKYEGFADRDPTSPAARAFVRLEDWANAGAPLPAAAAAGLFGDMIARDLPGRGLWRIAGRSIAPRALSCPAVEFVARNDRIVPAATAIGLADRRDVDAGHVGMIVGSRARAQLWEPLANWIDSLG